MPRVADPTIRSRLLDRAARVLATEGAGALSTRRLAAEVGTSTMAVYTHFGSMDELIRAVGHEAFDHLAAELNAVPITDDPIADLAALGLAYRRNAQADPNLYLAMFGSRPTVLREANEAEQMHGLATFDTLVRAVQRAVDAGLIDAGAEAAASQLWAAAHGATMLELAGLIDDDGATFAATTLAVLRGLRPA